jgi:hypothetical protein
MSAHLPVLGIVQALQVGVAPMAAVAGASADDHGQVALPQLRA